MRWINLSQPAPGKTEWDPSRKVRTTRRLFRSCPLTVSRPLKWRAGHACKPTIICGPNPSTVTWCFKVFLRSSRSIRLVLPGRVLLPTHTYSKRERERWDYTTTDPMIEFETTQILYSPRNTSVLDPRATTYGVGSVSKYEGRRQHGRTNVCTLSSRRC
jgi:hypothetical protein